MRRRLAVPVAWVIAVGAAYGAMHAARLPREGRVSRWFSLVSPRAGSVAAALRPNLDPRRWAPADRLLTLDLAAGRIGKQLAKASGARFIRLVISADGSSLYLLQGSGSNTLCVDSQTGARRVLSDLPPGCAVPPTTGPPPTPDWVAGGHRGARLSLGPPGRMPAWFDAYSSLVFARQFILWGPLPWAGTVSALEAVVPPNCDARWVVYSSGNFGGALYRVEACTLDASGEVVTPIKIADRCGPAEFAVLGAPHPALVISSDLAWNLSAYSLIYGTALPEIELPQKELAGKEIMASPRGSRVLVCAPGGDGVVYDAVLQRWACRLRPPVSSCSPWYFLSGDGRFTAAATATQLAPPPAGATPESATTLTVWDLSRIPPAAGEPASPGP